MPKFIGARIPIEGEFGWVLENKVGHLEEPETQSLKNSR